MASASTSVQDGLPLGKHLASTGKLLMILALSCAPADVVQQDKKTRDRAIKGLSPFLSDPSKDALSKPDMAKLWKGIFYCMGLSCRTVHLLRADGLLRRRFLDV